MTAITEYTLYDLRVGEEPLSAWQRYGVGDRLDAAISCPLCRCTRNGDPTEPNPHTEWCDDPTCRCHSEDES